MYLDAAKSRAREEVDLFLPVDSPPPRSIERGPELLDGSSFPESYSSYLGGDDVMLSLWRHSRVTGIDSGNCTGSWVGFAPLATATPELGYAQNATNPSLLWLWRYVLRLRN